MNTKPIPRVATVLLPSLKVSGGVHEALRLGLALAERGRSVEVCSLWRSPHPVTVEGLPHVELGRSTTRAWRVPLDLPGHALRFWRRRRRIAGPVLFTHYATLPLAALVPRRDRWVFVQDLEWRFIARRPVSALLRRIVLQAYRRSWLVAANAYLQEELTALGMPVEAVAPIWADPGFVADPSAPRDIDLVMVLRKGAHKRLDLYWSLLDALRRRAALRTLVITPEDEIATESRLRADAVLLRPDAAAMRAAYTRSRCFVHLSDHEGFGLPPLEAMGAGCVPYCRDSGGVRAYMLGPMRALLVDRARGIDAIADDLIALCGSPDRLTTLSAQAREVFVDGLHRTASQRESALKLLCEAVDGGGLR